MELKVSDGGGSPCKRRRRRRCSRGTRRGFGSVGTEGQPHMLGVQAEFLHDVGARSHWDAKSHTRDALHAPRSQKACAKALSWWTNRTRWAEKKKKTQKRYKKQPRCRGQPCHPPRRPPPWRSASAVGAASRRLCARLPWGERPTSLAPAQSLRQGLHQKKGQQKKKRLQDQAQIAAFSHHRCNMLPVADMLANPGSARRHNRVMSLVALRTAPQASRQQLRRRRGRANSRGAEGEGAHVFFWVKKNVVCCVCFRFLIACVTFPRHL